MSYPAKNTKIYITALFLSVLTFLLPGCQAALNINLFGTTTPTPTSTPVPTATEIPFADKSAKDQALEYFVAAEKYDTGFMDKQQRQEFSQELAGLLNQKRQGNPAAYNNEAYLDPNSFRMLPWNNGKPDSEKTIPIFHATTVDSEGYLLMENCEGAWVRIEGSKNMDWNMIVSEPDDPRVNWPPPLPQGEHYCGRMGGADWFMSGIKEKHPNYEFSQIPVVVLEKNIGQIYQAPWMDGIMRIHTVITDPAGNPVYARESVTTWGDFCIMEEGSQVDFTHLYDDPDRLADYLSNPANKTLIDTWEAFEINQVYYLGVPHSQVHLEGEWGVYPEIQGWKGLANLEDVYQILVNQKTNNDDLLIFFHRYLMKKGG